MQQTTSARKPAPAKNDSFYGAFQGLSLDGLMGGSSGSSAVAAGDQCKVMWDLTVKDNRTVCTILMLKGLERQTAHGGEAIGVENETLRLTPFITQEKEERFIYWFTVFISLDFFFFSEKLIMLVVFHVLQFVLNCQYLHNLCTCLLDEQNCFCEIWL